MSLDGFCWASPQIREAIIAGRITTGFSHLSFRDQDAESKRKSWFADQSLEDLIQPSSLDPQIAGELFILDTETKGIFRPQANESIYRTLLQLPGRQRQRADITNGFELKKGFTYLIPLQNKINLRPQNYVKSSPKSTFGRLFLNTRLLADYNPCFDEVHGSYKPDHTLDLWLLVQPLAFNLVLYPRLSLNQLRFFEGDGAQLSASKIREEWWQNPLLCQKQSGHLTPIINPIISEDGLQVHLNLSGLDTEEIVALRARHNPTAIDVRHINTHEAEHFFEPIVRKSDSITLKKGEYYLLSSAEVLQIPPHLNVELESHSHIGLTGPLHFAGFVDNGFQGDLVFEVRSDESSDMELIDGMPVSKLKVYRTAPSDKLYGTEIGSHYQKQTGPKPAKFFKPFDFAFAARNYEKLNKDVLVQDAKVLLRHRTAQEGFSSVTLSQAEELFKDIAAGFFQSRYDCEFDQLVLQPIPYVIVFGPEDTVFSYVRASDIKDYGDARLFGKHSIGLGGHIVRADGPEFIHKNIERELREEVEFKELYSLPKLVGTLMAHDKAVDRVHFGLIYTVHTSGEVRPKESSLKQGSLVPIESICSDPLHEQKYETWSRMLIPHLLQLYQVNL